MTIKAQKLVKEFERALRADPENLIIRLKLAAALREADRLPEAVAMYHGVARAYQKQGRLAQAIGVCQSVLEIEPHHDTQVLLAALVTAQAERAAPPPEERAPPLPPPPIRPTRNLRRPTDGDLSAHTPTPTPSSTSAVTPLSQSDPHANPGEASSPGLTFTPTIPTPPPTETSRLPLVPPEGDFEERMTDPQWARANRAEPKPQESDDEVTPAGHRRPRLQLRDERTDEEEQAGGMPEVVVFAEPPSDEEASAWSPQGDGFGAAEPTSPGRRSGKTSPGDPSTESPPYDDEITPGPLFADPFSTALDALAPDGSTIEQPMAIFRGLPQEAVRELIRQVELRRFPPGTMIVREGDAGDACYVIHSGLVRVLKQVDGEPVDVAHLGPGSLFGEFALLADRRRHATVEALKAVEAYEIPRRLLRQLAAQFPEMGPAIERLFRERLISTLIATAAFFRPLPEEQRTLLMARFVPRHAPPGERIVREGEPGPGLFLVVLGSVNITKLTDRGEVLLATLGEGSYFGEMSLLKGTMVSATVTAAGPVELAQLPPHDFYAIIAEHPVLWEEVRREALRRELATQNVLSGETPIA